MRKFLFYISAAVTGVAAAVIICGCFSVVRIESGAMLPAIEPGARVLVDKGYGGEDITAGDMVVVELPYFAMDGEGHYAARYVKARYGDVVELTCGEAAASEERLVVDVEDIVGKVIASG